MIRFLGLSLLLLAASPGFAQWSISKKATHAMDDPPSTPSEDVWLKITVRNDSSDTLYVEGIPWQQPWYMVEAYLKHEVDEVWERRNVFVDQPLKMLAVEPGSEFDVVRREAKTAIGTSMMLTFKMARSANDQVGRRILVGPFLIPEITQTHHDSIHHADISIQLPSLIWSSLGPT